MNHEETKIQEAIVNWLRIQYPDVLMTISPTGMKLSIYAGARLKRLGYLRGTPDLFILYASNSYHGLLL